MDEIKKIKKERRNKKRRESSFHVEQPRKAALKQRQLMNDLKPAVKQASNSVRVKLLCFAVFCGVYTYSSFFPRIQMPMSF